MIPRADALAALEREYFDLLVVGGGITGAGVALDAASRGFSVGLVEKSDFAAGTSGRSSKLIHGGLRHLQKLDLGLVREALSERSLMVKLAPHLVKPLPLLVASFDGKRPDRRTGVGLNLYDVMARRRGRDGDEPWSPARHRTVDGTEAVELAPALADRKPTAAYLFYDCQADDARLVLSVLSEAERFGAVVANRCEATGLIEADGRAAGAFVHDAESDATFEVSASSVVNATGVWADRLQPAERVVPHIRPSRGTHVTVPRALLPVEAGVIVPAAGGRTIFVQPWLGRTLVGTTDAEYAGGLDHVPSGERDVTYLLQAVNAFFGARLAPDDLSGAFAGVRPLISAGDSEKFVDISRRAELFESDSGLVTITGGKLTTWRRMAKLAVDRIVARQGGEAQCRTHEIQIGLPEEASALPDVPGIDEGSRVHLAARYGHEARAVMRLAAAAPHLSRPISPDLPDLAAEAAFAAAHEQARSLGDVLLRRTRLGVLDARRMADPQDEGVMLAARAMAGELGWDGARVEREVAAWGEEARLEALVPVGARPVTGDRGADVQLHGGAAPEEAA